MTSKTSLSKRVRKARAAAQFGRVMDVDGAGRVTHTIVPGSDGKHYEQFIRRDDSRMPGMTVECRIWTTWGTGPLCPGNGNGTICYHAMAALEMASRERANGKSKMSLSWCANDDDAGLLKRLGGKAIAVRPWRQAGAVWMVWKNGS